MPVTGPEKETLTLVLDQQREFREEQRAAMAKLTELVGGLDRRVQAMELKDATQVGVASATAAIAQANFDKSDKRQVSRRAWVAIGVTAAAALLTALINIIGVLNSFPH